MTDSILMQRDGDIATVVLNRPERMNVLDKAMWMRLGESMRELGADDSVRCIVLRGAGGKAFAAGADISEFASERANGAQARRYGEDVAGSMRALAESRHPTVALIEGACVGGGLLIASQCDLRICNESARFGVPVKNLGLTEAYDELQGMMRVIGPAASLEILLEAASGARAKPTRRGSSAGSYRMPKWRGKRMRPRDASRMVHRWWHAGTRSSSAGWPTPARWAPRNTPRATPVSTPRTSVPAIGPSWRRGSPVSRVAEPCTLAQKTTLTQPQEE